ncbi:BZIP domain-containing protein [Pseudozyma hubeiensis]|nr:BZIP domain-containing protein [Pseudozyma hubeiensis]
MAAVTSGTGAWTYQTPSYATAQPQHAQKHAQYNPQHHHQQQQQHYHHHPTSSSCSLGIDDAAPRTSLVSAAPTFSHASSEQGASSSYRTSASSSYQSHPIADDYRRATASSHLSESRLHYSSLPASSSAIKRRGRSKSYASEEARQAAKQAQKARRREQNRDAQRRLRDRKEEHIFKLEGELAQLRQETDRHRSEVQGLEEMIRRLLAERQDLHRRLGVQQEQGKIGRNNALGLVDDLILAREGDASGSRDSANSSRSNSASDEGGKDGSSRSSSATSASVSTPRSPPITLHNSYATYSAKNSLSSAPFTQGRMKTPSLHLPKIKLEPSSSHASNAHPPVSATHPQWNLS